MKQAWRLAVPLAFLVAISACAPPEAETPPEVAEPVVEDEPADPTVVDPDHYQVVEENELVRVLRISYGPGEESVPHFHPDHVAVFLTEVDAEFRLPDGTTEAAQAEAGTHLYMAAGDHDPRHVGDQPFEAVAFELKTAGGASGEEAETGPDPTEVDAGHYVTELDNERVRVLRVTYGPGEESVMHYHPEHFAVALNDTHFEFLLPDGTTQEIEAKAGEHILAPAGLHQPRNLRDEAAEVIVIEPR